MARQARLREVLRRAERRHALRQRQLRGRTPRRGGGLHLRNHRQTALRRQERAAGHREQQQPLGRAARLDRRQPLRRHLPRRRAHRHRPHGRLAPLLRFGRRVGQAHVGDPRAGRGRGRNPPHLLVGRGQLPAHARHHRSRRHARLHAPPARAPRRAPGIGTLLGRRPRAVEPRPCGTLPLHRAAGRAAGARRGERPHGLPLGARHPRGALHPQRQLLRHPRRDALSRQCA